MNRRLAIFCALLLATVTAGAYTVDLTLFNTFPLLQNNGSTPLPGTTANGALVQLILAGQNGLRDAPSFSGAPGGDDQLLFTTHVGMGLLLTNAGLLVQSSIILTNLAGSYAYVRFWDTQAVQSTHYYGVSSVFALPNGDAFGLAEYDFVPTALSSRRTDTEFQSFHNVPEPDSLFLYGALLFGLAIWWQRRRIATLSVAFALATGVVFAQDLRRFEVTASATIRNADGSTLPGSNPDVGTPIAGCLVQILDVGANGTPDLPDTAGQPTGDDLIVATTVIGKGVAPNVAWSGRFAASFYPPQAAGKRLYARVFNAPTVEAATHWGQSATFVVDGTAVMDVSALGLLATTMPKATDPRQTDTDGDGQNDYIEWQANTNPLDKTDRFEVKQLTCAPGQPSQLRIAGRAGRGYILQRTTNLLGGWQDVLTNATLTANTDLLLQDPSPPDTDRAFYRVRVITPRGSSCGSAVYCW